jgi:hypothetical protein
MPRWYWNVFILYCFTLDLPVVNRQAQVWRDTVTYRRCYSFLTAMGSHIHVRAAGKCFMELVNRFQTAYSVCNSYIVTGLIQNREMVNIVLLQTYLFSNYRLELTQSVDKKLRIMFRFKQGKYNLFFPQPSDWLWGSPSLSMGTGVSILRDKAAGTWSWLLTSFYCWD